MASLNTVKKAVDRKSLQIATLDTIAELTAIKVARWQKRETARLLTSQANNVYIFPTKKGYKIGRFTITGYNNYWEVTAPRVTERFSTKAQAVIYSTLIHRGQDQLAKDFREHNRLVDKYTTDIMYYKHNIKQSKDEFRRDALYNRLEDSAYHLAAAQNNLKKTIISAKYIKLWEEN